MKNSGIPISKLGRRYQDQAAAQLHGPQSHGNAPSRPDAALDEFQIPPAAQKPAETAKTPGYPVTLWVPYQVRSWNRLLGKHWSALDAEKKLARSALFKVLLLWRQLVGTPGARPPEATGRLHLIITMYRVQLMDPDNAAVKPLVDQLRYAGLILDDNPDALALTIQQVKLNTRKGQQTRVTITDLLP